MDDKVTLEKVVAWAKRRGFVYPSSEIYGGMANTYDFGPYGTTLKELVKQAWWRKFISSREDMYGIDSSVILNPKVWESSGHTAGFADVMVEDKVTHKRYRADHLIEERLERMSSDKLQSLISIFSKPRVKYISDPNSPDETKIVGGEIGGNNVALEKAAKTGKVDGLSPDQMKEIMIRIGEVDKTFKSPDGNELTEPKRFNQLFETQVGIIAGEKNSAYMRGEIAQGLFMNYKNVLDSMHPALPFGIGQAGKAFRNEITMGKFTFRTLEFDLMEFEYFFDEAKQDWNELFEFWQKQVKEFALEMGIAEENLRWRPHEEFELSHYSSRTEDLEYKFPWGFKEMFAVAYRTDFDLRNHQEKSGKDLRFTYPDGTKILPHVIEPTFGLSRFITIMIMDAYREEEVNGKLRTVLKFDPKIAPVQVAIFPLQKDEKLAELAKKLYQDLRGDFRCEYDNAGNIGKMYRRQDEIGTPFCVTIDYESLEDDAVTLRMRDSMEQKRIKIKELHKQLSEIL